MILSRMGLLAGAATLCTPVLTHADDDDASARGFSVALEYSVAPDCPDARDFRAVVSDRLGYDPFRDNAPDRVLVHIVSLDRGLEAHLEWRNAAGEWAGDQRFPSRSADCGELVRAVGFALAVKIHLLALSAATPRSSADTTEQSTPPDKPSMRPPPAPAIVDAAKDRERDAANVPEVVSHDPPPVFALGAGASVGFGLAPSPVPIGRVFGSVAWSHLVLELGGEASLPATTRRADGAGLSQRVLLVTAAGCGMLERWSGCLLGKAGQIRIVGQDVAFPASPSGPLLEAGLRFGVTQRFGRTFAAARAEGLAILTPWTAALDDVPVWTAPPFSAAAGLDFGVELP